MRPVVGYVAVAGLGVGGVTAVLWPFLGPDARTGVLAAAGVTLPVQCTAFGLLVWARERRRVFMAMWAGGILVRLGTVLVAALVVARLPALPVTPTLLALAGFLFGLLLVEPFFLGWGAPQARESADAVAVGTGRARWIQGRWQR